LRKVANATENDDSKIIGVVQISYDAPKGEGVCQTAGLAPHGGSRDECYRHMTIAILISWKNWNAYCLSSQATTLVNDKKTTEQEFYVAA